MKKEKIITRTITTLDCSVIGITDSGEVKTLVINTPVIDDKKLFSYIRTACPADFSPAKIVKVETNEQLYGMPESVFMAHAVKLPPRGTNNDNKEQD